MTALSIGTRDPGLGTRGKPGFVFASGAGGVGSVVAFEGSAGVAFAQSHGSRVPSPESRGEQA